MITSIKAVKTSGLTKYYNDQCVLDNINLEIDKAKISGLVGQNGAGKTTLIKCITNLIKYNKGEINIFGEQQDDNNIQLKKRIGVLLENLEDIFIYLKGSEFLEFSGRIMDMEKKQVAERIRELTIMFSMEAAMDQVIYDYSKGMKKRIALMGLILRNPDLYILDEPFEGLDSITIIKIKNILKALKNNGKTIMLSSHILSVVEDVTDDVSIIHKGKIIFQSATKDIRNKIKDKITRETYSSLEEVFFTLTSDKEDQMLSWLKSGQ